MAMTGVDFMRIENGRIKEIWLFAEDQEAVDRFWSGRTEQTPELGFIKDVSHKRLSN